MNAGCTKMVYIDFYNPTYPRDFSVIIYLSAQISKILIIALRTHTSPEAFFGFKKKTEETAHTPCTMKVYRLQKQYAVKYLCSFSKEILINAGRAQNLKITIIHGNVNFIGECSSMAHFKGNFIQIKNQIGTIPLKSIVSHF